MPDSVAKIVFNEMLARLRTISTANGYLTDPVKVVSGQLSEHKISPSDLGKFPVLLFYIPPGGWERDRAPNASIVRHTLGAQCDAVVGATEDYALLFDVVADIEIASVLGPDEDPRMKQVVGRNLLKEPVRIITPTFQVPEPDSSLHVMSTGIALEFITQVGDPFNVV